MSEYAPGVYTGMPDEEYFAIDALSRTDLTSWIKPYKGDPRVLIVGSALHSAVLMSDFEEKYICPPKDHPLENFKLNRNDGKRYELDLRTTSGRIPLKKKEWDAVMTWRNAIGLDAEAWGLIEGATGIEVVVVGRFPHSDLLCKAKIDVVRPNSLIDIKTTSCADAREFQQAIVKYGYANQAAWYLDLYAEVTGTDKGADSLPRRWAFLCVGKDTHDVWVHTLDWTEQHGWDILSHGRQWRQDMMTIFERYST